MITIDNLHWVHAGLSVYAIVGNHTINDAIISNPNAPNRYSVYEQIEGEEVFIAAYTTLEQAINHINTETI